MKGGIYNDIVRDKQKTVVDHYLYICYGEEHFVYRIIFFYCVQIPPYKSNIKVILNE